MFLQRLLLILGVVGLLVVLIDLGISIAATYPGTTPARVDRVTAGPYHLTVDLYSNPANAGYALAFAVAPTQAVNGSLTYRAFSLPGKGVDATPIRATFHTDPNVRNGIQGAAEITVRGPWTLQVTANGPASHSRLARLAHRLRSFLCVVCVLCDATASFQEARASCGCEEQSLTAWNIHSRQQ